MSKVDRVPFTTTLNPELKQKFRIYCAKNNLYQNEVLENLIRELLDKHIKEGGNDGNTD